MSDIQDFSVYMETAGMFFGIDPLTPLLGSGSLRMHRNGITAQHMYAVRSVGDRAFASGRARFLIGAKTRVSADALGCVFMASAGLTALAGSAYICRVDLGLSTATMRLYSTTTGLDNMATVSAAGTAFSFLVGSVAYIEVTWIQDLANLGGIRLTAKRGATVLTASALVLDPTLLDWDAMILDPGLEVILTSGVLTTSTGEGPFFRLASPTGAGDYLMEFPPSADGPAVIPIIVGG